MEYEIKALKMWDVIKKDPSITATKIYNTFKGTKYGMRKQDSLGLTKELKLWGKEFNYTHSSFEYGLEEAKSLKLFRKNMSPASKIKDAVKKAKYNKQRKELMQTHSDAQLDRLYTVYHEDGDYVEFRSG